MAVDLYEFTVLGRIAGNPCANVMHFASSEVSSDNPLNAAAAIIAAWYAAGAGAHAVAYLACLPDNYFLKGFRCRRVNNTGGPTGSLPAANEAGARAGAADFSGAGPVGLWHCALTPPSDVWPTGKLFFPGASVDDVEENIFDPALVGACSAFMGLWTPAFGAGPEGPFTQKVLRKSDGVGLEILNSSVSLKVGTQRRRYVPL